MSALRLSEETAYLSFLRTVNEIKTMRPFCCVTISILDVTAYIFYIDSCRALFALVDKANLPKLVPSFLLMGDCVSSWVVVMVSFD